jgi:hypothetical protein
MKGLGIVLFYIGLFLILEVFAKNTANKLFPNFSFSSLFGGGS